MSDDNKKMIVEGLVEYLEGINVFYERYRPGFAEDVEKAVPELLKKVEDFFNKSSDPGDPRMTLGLMAASCAKFLVRKAETSDMKKNQYDYEMDLYLAFGELRGMIGFYLKLLTYTYEVEVSEKLAAIYPNIVND